ncbi:MAG: 5-formyltetrahydrofolate cyclo-ligase [Phycisphaerales bacterium]|jgi:5-formyltetrahydrofolate cyclo-ligase|nr:5-formyltetrahydrofolate cyclo-ligase [Phycisphaerales bacterium]
MSEEQDPHHASKSAVRRQLRELLDGMSAAERHQKSLAACSLITASPEFAAARCIMLYVSIPTEVDTAPLALRAWQAEKTVVVPKVSWDQRRMLPIEISSLTTGMTSTGPGIREPIAGTPMPLDMIDLVIVPGLGFTNTGYRIGRGMGFYDRFLAQDDFLGISCGLAFSEQVVSNLPVLDHDVPLSMLATDKGLTRFTSNCIEKK